jgi:hypothetical protein
VGHVARMGEMKNGYTCLVVGLQGRDHLEDLRNRRRMCGLDLSNSRWWTSGGLL